MTLDGAISLIYLVLVSALLAAIAVKRVLWTSPVFFAYICFDLLSAATEFAIYRHSGFSVWYSRLYLVELAGDCLLYFWVLTELGKNLLRVNRKSRPRWNLAVLLFAAAAAVIGALSQWAEVPSRTPLSNICFLGFRADGTLQFAGFLALISWSALRKFHWPERELHIATGFGFVTFAWFLISLLLFRWSTGPVYRRLSEVLQAAFLAALAYWLHYFWIVDRGLPARNAHAGPESRSGRNDREPTQRSTTL